MTETEFKASMEAEHQRFNDWMLIAIADDRRRLMIKRVVLTFVFMTIGYGVLFTCGWPWGANR